MLKVGDKFFFGLLLAGVMFGGLTLLPYIDRNPSRKFRIVRSRWPVRWSPP